MSKSLKEPRITYISFLECELRGYWANNASKGKSTADHWIAKESGCSMWIVRQDSQRRGRIFRQGAQIILSGNTVRFIQKEVMEKIRTVKKGETLVYTHKRIWEFLKLEEYCKCKWY